MKIDHGHYGIEQDGDGQVYLLFDQHRLVLTPVEARYLAMELKLTADMAEADVT